METVKIDKTFANQEQCDAWEAEHFPDRTYKGRKIMCVYHACEAGNDEVTITDILVI